jgi:hydroxyacylglutathione hydrolase
MILESKSLWVAETNAWIVAPERGGPAVVIDAPPDAGGIADLLARHDLYPEVLLLTHGHVDHMGGARQVGEMGAAVHVHPADDYLTLDPAAQLRAIFGFAPSGTYLPPPERHPLADGMEIETAGLTVEVRHTPGHTPGHCCFLLAGEGWLFSGDQLFAGSVGRTDLPGGDHAALLASMRTRVLHLDDDTRVLPGHGPETTVGRERRTNPFI